MALDPISQISASIKKRLESDRTCEVRKKICENMEKRLQEIDEQKTQAPTDR